MYINKNLLYLRMNSGMSLRKLETLAMVPHTVIERIEKQETSNPSIKTIIKICAIFKVSIDDFIFVDLSEDIGK